MHEGTLGALHRANHAIHLLAAGYWFGSLAPLLVCLRYLQPPQWRSDAITTLIRFSRWGHLAVAAVIVTGIVNSLIILGGWPLNLSSPYQRLLLIKTALVALMVMVALANRYAIVPAMSWGWRCWCWSVYLQPMRRYDISACRRPASCGKIDANSNLKANT
jgi:putative copper resistance protein D